MASRDKKDLHHILVQAYDLACARYKELYPNDPQPFLTCTFRSNEEQTELYAQGRTKPGKIVTQAKAGQSAHNYNPSFAFDIGFINPITKKLDWNQKLFKNFAACIKQFSSVVECGADWKFLDLPHFELRGWKTW